jgi:hypothetical protein
MAPWILCLMNHMVAFLVVIWRHGVVQNGSSIAALQVLTIGQILSLEIHHDSSARLSGSIAMAMVSKSLSWHHITLSIRHQEEMYEQDLISTPILVVHGLRAFLMSLLAPVSICKTSSGSIQITTGKKIFLLMAQALIGGTGQHGSSILPLQLSESSVTQT